MLKNVLALILLACFIFLLVFIFQPIFNFSFSSKPLIITTPITQRLPTTPISENEVAKQITPNEIEVLNLQKDLQAEITSIGASNNVSLYYKNLEEGYEVTINPDRSWIPASIVKAFVVIEAFRQKRLRLINFDSRVTIKQGNIVANELEDPAYQPLRTGVKATIRELIGAMITQSDNTAYNTLIDVLDRRNVTSTLRQLGLTNTVVGEKLNLSDEQYQLDSLVPGRQLNRTTVSDFGRLFTLLFEKKINDSDEILTIFKKQKLNNMIPKLLPSDVVVAHKTGFWSPYYHDGGIVYKKGDRFVLVIFTDRDDPNIIARLAKICYYKTRDVVLGVSTSNPFQKIIELFYKIKSMFK